MKLKHRNNFVQTLENKVWTIFPELDEEENWSEVIYLIEEHIDNFCYDLDELIKEKESND